MRQESIEYVKQTHRNMVSFPKMVGISCLQWMFQNNPEYPWSPSPTESKILIQEDGIFPEEVGTRPIVVMSRAPISFLSTSMDQRKSGTFQFMGGARNYKESFLDLVQCSLTFNCIGKTRIVAEYIAMAVVAVFHFFHTDVQAVFNIHDLELRSIGSDQALMGADGRQFLAHFIPVNVHMIWPYEWTKYQLDPEVLRQLFIEQVDENGLTFQTTDP